MDHLTSHMNISTISLRLWITVMKYNENIRDSLLTLLSRNPLWRTFSHQEGLSSIEVPSLPNDTHPSFTFPEKVVLLRVLFYRSLFITRVPVYVPDPWSHPNSSLWLVHKNYRDGRYSIRYIIELSKERPYFLQYTLLLTQNK